MHKKEILKKKETHKMVSQREKLERIETVLGWIEEEKGVKYTVDAYAPRLFNLNQVLKGGCVSMRTTGDLAHIASYLQGWWECLREQKHGNKYKGM
jgi:hypothetical protein